MNFESQELFGFGVGEYEEREVRASAFNVAHNLLVSVYQVGSAESFVWSGSEMCFLIPCVRDLVGPL